MKKLRYLSIVLGIVFSYTVAAQIVSPGGADYANKTYNSDVNDSTFIFTYFFSSISDNNKTPTLKARSMGNSPANFNWYRFDRTTKTVEPTPFRTDIDVTESDVTFPSGGEGGYLVVIETEEIIDTFRAWLFYDIIRTDSVSYTQNCEYLQLTAYASSNRNNFSAYDYSDFCDLNSVKERYISNNYTVEWNSDINIYEELPNVPQSWKKRINSMVTRISSANEPSDADRPLVPGLSAPFRAASYSVKITNVFLNTTEEYKTEPIPAMGLYAAFDVLVPDDYGVFVPTKNLSGEALWRMKLENKSINADRFEWTGWNDQTINFLQNDTLWRYYTENIPDEINYKPGSYPVKLSVENTRTGCRHSSYALDAGGKRKDIDVAKSAFSSESLPNAFTPNGDGNNDFFTFVKGQEPVSMRTMNLKIVTRNGTLVYKYKGEVSAWEGWNGKMNGNGSDCSSGVYYYIISGEGWDDKSYSGKSYTGVLHLYRGN
ncbi:MAG: gliding motility-associated C-terminal domain-containing protein [Prevotellaceae bacterium]|jgi:gliding motility-associated-like protein|nr:gliding motility-associated C-terminal domain-containing protein [Prevotellaceae bacterium]